MSVDLNAKSSKMLIHDGPPPIEHSSFEPSANQAQQRNDQQKQRPAPLLSPTISDIEHQHQTGVPTPMVQEAHPQGQLQALNEALLRKKTTSQPHHQRNSGLILIQGDAGHQNQEPVFTFSSSLKKRVSINENCEVFDAEKYSRNVKRRCSSILTDGSIRSILSNGKSQKIINFNIQPEKAKRPP